MDFEISALIGMNLGDLKSLVSVGEVPPDPTESRRKKSPVSRKKVNGVLGQDKVKRMKLVPNILFNGLFT
jgi:hypothetical protein